MKLKVLLVLLLAFGLSMVSVANADIIAEFEDAGTPGVDTYAGAAGDGWRGGWGVDPTGTGNITPTLDTTSPLYVDSNTYLDTNLTDTTTNGYSASLNRRFYTTDLNDDYRISFSIRFDDITMWSVKDTTSGNSSDYFYLAGTNDDLQSHVVANTGWAVRVQGNKADDSLATALQFRFLAGATGSGSTSSQYSGFPVQEGNTYEFLVTVHAADYTYEATVSEVGTTNTYTTTTVLNMESQIVTDYLYFGTEMKNAGGKTFGYSLDNIRIANVPEPGTLVLLVSGLLGLLIWRKKK